MGDMREAYDALKEHKRSRKNERYAKALAMLAERKIRYQLGRSSNIIVAGRYELWPSTHAWFDRRSGKRGRGIDGFMKMVSGAGG